MPRELTHSFLRSGLFAGLPPPCLLELAELAERQRYLRGSVIVHQDEPGDTLHILERGHVKVRVRSGAGDEAIIAVLGPGECFGELALLDGAPRSATVAALTDIETLALRRDAFLPFLQANPLALDGLLRTLAQRLRRTSGLAADLAFLDTAGLLARALLELVVSADKAENGRVEIDLRVNQSDLASMIGAKRQYVNKLLGTFEDQGILRRDGHIIVIRDLERLSQRAH